MSIDLCVDDTNKQELGASLKIIGVGGAGGNAVNSMIDSADLEVASFLIANTDAQALTLSPAPTKIQLGAKVTKGLGAGSNPEVGRRAAEEDLETMMAKIDGSDILFLTGGLGGGTGSGALPVIAAAARELGVLTVAIVTKPFLFEGKRRARIAEEAIKNLRSAVDTLIVVPNQRLLEIVDEKISMLDAFALSNDILKQAIKGISDIITKSGHINVDFADVRAIMKDMGMALMGTGKASGEHRAREAAQKAISSPLLENVSIEGAKGVLINITGNTDLGLYEINEAASLVYDLVSEDANIILGSVIDTDMGDEVMVTVIATGFETVRKEDFSRKNMASSEYEYMDRVAHDHTAQIKQEVDAHIHGARKQVEQEAVAVEKTDQTPARQEAEPVAMKQERTAPASVEKDVVDVKDLDTPTFLRKKEEAKTAANSDVKVEVVKQENKETAPVQEHKQEAQQQAPETMQKQDTQQEEFKNREQRRREKFRHKGGF